MVKILPLSKKGYLLIPMAIRRRLGMKPGGKIQLIEEQDTLVVKAVPDDPIAAATGCVREGVSLAEDLLSERKSERERERRKFGHR